MWVTEIKSGRSYYVKKPLGKLKRGDLVRVFSVDHEFSDDLTEIAVVRASDGPVEYFSEPTTAEYEYLASE